MQEIKYGIYDHAQRLYIWIDIKQPFKLKIIVEFFLDFFKTLAVEWSEINQEGVGEYLWIWDVLNCNFSDIVLKSMVWFALFMLWIKDLSQPDTVAILPFHIPMYGDQFNILTIVYAISMFIQQKIMMKDPKQKMMVYLMPVMMLLFLNRWSSGFILYFIIFNLLSIAQRYIVSDKDQPVTKPDAIPVVSNPKKNQPKKRTKKGKKK